MLLAFAIGVREFVTLTVVAGLFLWFLFREIAIISKSPNQSPDHSPQSQNPEQRLSQLNDLFAKKLITEVEYQERRAAILKDL